MDQSDNETVGHAFPPHASFIAVMSRRVPIRRCGHARNRYSEALNLQAQL